MRRVVVAFALLTIIAGCGASKHASVPTTALLTDVRAGGTSVSFRFRSAPQHVTWRYTPRARVAESGSGKPVEIGAPVVAVVHFTPAATAEPKGDSVALTYTGPRRLAGTGPIRDVVKVSDFEADVAWAIGLDSRLPVHVSREGATVTVSVG
jgi:hypothetical protein